MKENIFDVLMYLFENYMEDEIEALPDSDIVRTELEEAGFDRLEVNKAFDWLESLSVQGRIRPTQPLAFRIFCSQEKAKLDLDCQNLLIYLEASGILTSANREIVIDRIMALENEDISVEKLKWIILMVLLSQPDQEIAFSRMEDIVYNLVPAYIH
jgi:Smg protein